MSDSTILIDTPLPISIAQSASQSSNVQIGSSIPAAIITPAVMTGAKFFFTASIDGINFFPLYDEQGTRIEADYNTSEAQYISLSAIADHLKAARHLRLISVDSEGAVAAQAAARTLSLVFRRPLS